MFLSTEILGFKNFLPNKYLQLKYSMLPSKRKLTFSLAQNRRAIRLCQVSSLAKTCMNERPPRPTYRWAKEMGQASEKSTFRSSRTRRLLEIWGIVSWLLKGFFKTKLYVDSIHLFEKLISYASSLNGWCWGIFHPTKKVHGRNFPQAWHQHFFFQANWFVSISWTVNFLTDLILW